MTQPPLRPSNRSVHNTYVDRGITFDMETGQPLIVPGEPWKPRFHWTLKTLGAVGLLFAFSTIGGGAPTWVVALSWPVALVGVAMFFIDSARRHPWAWRVFLQSAAFWAFVYGARHVYRVHRAHEREAMANAVANEFQRRGL